MSREIKFRIWDKKFKKWLTSGDGGTHCSSNWAIDPFTGKIIDYVECNDSHMPYPEREFYYESSKIICESPFVKQQYTGLKDKNGVEIYEGDIVKIFNHPLYEEVVYEPEGSGFGFFIHDDENRYNAAFEFLSDWTGSDGYEVIGNIFENNELLSKCEK